VVVVGRSERDREASNEKLTAELDDKRTSAAKLSDQTELDQLKSELTRVRSVIVSIVESCW